MVESGGEPRAGAGDERDCVDGCGSPAPEAARVSGPRDGLLGDAMARHNHRHERTRRVHTAAHSIPCRFGCRRFPMRETADGIVYLVVRMVSCQCGGGRGEGGGGGGRGSRGAVGPGGDEGGVVPGDVARRVRPGRGPGAGARRE